MEWGPGGGGLGTDHSPGLGAGARAGQAARTLPAGPGPGPEDLTQPSVRIWVPRHMSVVRTTGPDDDGV